MPLSPRVAYPPTTHLTRTHMHTHTHMHAHAPHLTRHPAAFAMVLGLTGVGAVGMGLISFVVKVVHIPLTQVLVLKNSD